MNNQFEYVNAYYGLNVSMHQRVVVDGRKGIVIADKGHYLGVNFDDDKPGVISHVHPTWKVQYGGIGKPRKITRSQARYRRYLEQGDMFDSFIHFCYWDAKQRGS